MMYWYLLLYLPANSYLKRLHAMRQGNLLWVLAIAVKKGQSLAPVVVAQGEDAPRYWRTRLAALSELLNAGAPLDEALAQVPGLVTGRTLRAIRVGVQTGALSAALGDEAARFSHRQSLVNAEPGWGFGQFLATFLIMNAVVGYLMYYIIPKYSFIFSGFDMELPGSTVKLIAACDAVARFYWIVPFLLLVASPAAITLLGDDEEDRATRRRFCRWLFSAVRGSWQSLAHALDPRRAAPGILRNLALIVEAGQPLPELVASLADLQPAASVRRRLVQAAHLLEQGYDCWQALLVTRIIDENEAVFLDAAQRTGNVPWALRSLSEAIEQRFRNRRRRQLEWLRPACIFGLGAVVGSFVAAVFLPLITLITALS